jgi:hypothetical protein
MCPALQTFSFQRLRDKIRELLVVRPYNTGSHMTMFLNEDELLELTGKQRASSQQKALRQMGITFRTRADGKTLVLKETVLQLFDVKAASRAPRKFTMNLENA